jgi:hypothetical protein
MYIAGNDGTDLALAAEIRVEVDGVPGSNDMPGRILLRTTPDGSQAPVDAVKIDSAQNVTVSAGNLVIGTAGKGIDFSADPSAPGMTSELLDDYEEGTFTPTVSSSGTPPTVTSYLNRLGFYTKIGNRVFATIFMRATLSSAGTGFPVITGLPYAASGNCLNGPTFGLANLISVQGSYATYISGTTIQFATSGYVIANDY